MPTRRPPKKRRKRPSPKARYEIITSERGPSCLLLNSRGRIVNAINGGKNDSESDLRRACAVHFPDAVEVERVPGKTRYTYVPGGRDGQPVVDTVTHTYRKRK